MSKKNLIIVLALFVVVFLVVGYFIFTKLKKDPTEEYVPTIEEELILQELLGVETPVSSDGQQVKTEKEIVEELTRVVAPSASADDERSEEEIVDSLINLTP